MSTETCKLCHKDCTPWVHINGHICQDCYAKSKKLPTIKDYMSDDEWEQMNNRYEWISIKDRLPENNDYVLTYIECSTKSVRSNWYMNNEERWHEGDDGITHWMPLPPPPENINET